MSLDTLAVSKNTKEHSCSEPQYSLYYQCIEYNYEAFERVYDTKYLEKFEYFRPIVSKIIYKYLDCGILANGFARVSAVIVKMNIYLRLAAREGISVHRVMLKMYELLGNLPA